MSVGFTLRASPFPGVGGMFATGQGEGNPIIIARLGLEQQLWVQAHPNEAGGGFAIFSKDNQNLTWKFTKPDDPITLAETDEPSLWHINTVSQDDGQEVVQIVAQTGLIGSTWYANSNDDNVVSIKAIPATLHAPPGPVWKKSS